MSATWRIIEGDCRDVLRSMPAQSAHTCVTSPPYFGLRDYGTGEWDGGDPACDHAQGRPGAGRADGRVDDRAQRNRDGVGAMGGDCRRCGARRVDRQIGLEPTPDEFVAALVAVFREVRRVLRDDGTVWLNLGDSYVSNPISAGGLNEIRADEATGGVQRGHARRVTFRGNGFKPKDLLGIPWAVAQALRAPYYTGTIKDERNRIWLAAMIDAEGCMFIHKRKAGSHNGQGYYRKQDQYGAGLEVSSTDRVIVERVMQIVGRGSICEQGPDQNARRRQTIYRWNLRSNECREVVREVYPYLVAKQHEARLLIGCPPSGAQAEAAWEALKAIHQGGSREIDFPAPPSMFEPGWYLRSDVIWSKANPMPESVTDRPTKAHEYVFLLSKSAKYHYDGDAIREPHAEKTLTHRGNGGMGKAGQQDALGKVASGNLGDMGYVRQVDPRGANKRSVWTVATQPYAGAHFATFPPKLIEPCILAGAPKDGTVLDPFAGAGTTGVVALNHGRSFVGIELNPEYAEMARWRIRDDSPLFNGNAEVVA